MDADFAYDVVELIDLKDSYCAMARLAAASNALLTPLGQPNAGGELS